MSERFIVTYHVRSTAADVDGRAQTIAVEQSVEMPLAAITSETVLNDIVGRVEGIDDLGNGTFSVRIGLAVDTVGQDTGQLLNMAFGNTSLHDDVVLKDIDFPPSLLALLPGPHHGIASLRARLKLRHRALTGSALKPQGLAPQALATLAEHMARGGLDFIKDDHGLANQSYSLFEQRVRACAEGIQNGARATGHPTRYVPSVTGNLDEMRQQARLLREIGVDCLMIAPMICGFPTMQTLVSEFSDLAFFAHPSLGGASRIAPELLIGRLFRLMGADAVIFPNYGGRFGYSQETCRQLAKNARQSNDNRGAALPVPAGGMTLDRAKEIVEFYGTDTMLLIGGNLLMAKERITEESERFSRAVGQYSLGV